VRAGEKAQVLFAPQAAVEQFTRALDAASRLSRTPPPQLYRARGRAYDTLGDFDHARNDYEAALQAARQKRDRYAEWQVLLDLGLLWAGRDYGKYGTICQQALTLARTLNDPVVLAHSLNRVGNWYTNAAQPREALPYHHEALAMFETLDHKPGVAETLDLLGVANYSAGDLLECADLNLRAEKLFRELDNRQGLTLTLSTWALTAGTYQSDAGATNAMEFDEALGHAELAVTLAQEMDWRSGLSIACIVAGMFLSARGEFDRGFEYFSRCISNAQEIGHHQWVAAAMSGLGALYVDLMAAEDARRVLEPALAIAREMGSRLWLLSSTPVLASAYLLSRDWDAAEAVLEGAEVPPIGEADQGGRRCWMVRAELCLVRGDANQTLRIVDELMATDPHISTERQVPRLARIRGEALVRLGRFEDAEMALVAANEGAVELGRNSHRWRALIALGHLYRQRRRYAAAEDAFLTARELIAELANAVPDEGIRETFLRETNALFPRTRASTASRVAKQLFGGLTTREQDVAALIAGGNSNRAIADTLVVSESTVATHVSHILGKLDLTSRTQIATWAIEIGLVSPPDRDSR
jgi:DNA-binding CsgD family transcriptional regulator/Flp pilus assembly protein TadD